MDARASAIVLDSNMLLDDDDGRLLIATATLLAGGAYSPARTNH